MTIIYRTAGAWGAGKGSNLTPAEVDENFFDLATRVLTLESDPPDLNQISNITVTGGQFTVHMEDGSTFGPFNLPVAVFQVRGVWAPTTAYNFLDLVTIASGGNAGVYIVLQSHTSEAVFNPALSISGNAVYHFAIPVGTGPTFLQTDMPSQVHGLTEKANPEDDDELLIEDSSAGYAKKRVKKSNIASAATDATDFKESVRVVTTTPITLSGEQTYDSVPLVEGDFALVNGQATVDPHINNGLWVVHTGVWTRRPDADTSAEVTSGMLVFVEEGAANGNRLFALITPDPIVLGTTPLKFRRSGKFPVSYVVVRNVFGASYTLALNDSAKWLKRVNASAATTTIPADADVRFPVNSEILVQWYGAGVNSIVAGAGVTINSASGTLTLPSRYSVARLKKLAANLWSLDFPVTEAPVDGTRYVRKDGAWLALTGGVSALDDLSDVATAGETTGDLLRFDGTNWVPARRTVELMFALSDEGTAITTGTAKLTARMPHAMTLTGVRANLNTASTSGLPTVDINVNGSTILSTKLTIDATEKTSLTAATAAVISAATLADDDEITFDIDVAGTGAKGLKVTLIGNRG